MSDLFRQLLGLGDNGSIQEQVAEQLGVDGTSVKESLGFTAVDEDRFWGTNAGYSDEHAAAAAALLTRDAEQRAALEQRLRDDEDFARKVQHDLNIAAQRAESEGKDGLTNYLKAHEL